MSYERYGAAAYGGSTLGRKGRLSGGTPVTGYDAVFYWSSTSSGAYGQSAYGGRRTVSFPVAGLYAVPDDAAAAVTVPVWWPFASYLEVQRVDAATGDRTPVRAGDPATVIGASHHNGVSNPKAAVDTSGLSAGANTTLSRLTALTVPAAPTTTTGVRLTATAAGAVTMNVAGDAVAPIPTTYGLAVRASAVPSSAALVVEWYDAAGTDLGAQSYPIATAALAASAASGGTWAYTTVTISSWPAGSGAGATSGAAATGTLSYTAAGLPAGGTFDITNRIAEPAATYAGYFDGDWPGAGWEGTVGQSFSDVGPITYVIDAEAPFDVPVYYELTNPEVGGYTATSETVTLHSSGLVGTRDAVLTHPGLDLSVRVWVEEQPEVTKALPASSFAVIGRRRPVVISDPQRKSDTGTLTFITETLDERDRLLTMLDDGSPMLLRAPSLYGHPPLWWLAFGDVKEAPLSGYAGNTLRRLTADFTEVDRPSVATRPLVL